MRAMETSAARACRRRTTGGPLSFKILLASSALSMLLLLPAAPPLHAADTASSASPLREALDNAGSGPARLALTDGSTAVGRIVGIEADRLTIRRASGGLRILALGDIVELKIRDEGGTLRPGRVVRLADGSVGWMSTEALAENEAGGPLVPVEDDAKTEVVAIRSQDVASPEADLPAGDAPIDLEISADAAGEGDRLIYFRLTLSEPAPRPILIIYTTIDGTAKAPGDYTHRQGVVVFEPGQTQAMVATSLVNDEASEGPEAFEFFVTGDPAAVRIERRKIAATIEDDDG